MKSSARWCKKVGADSIRSPEFFKKTHIFTRMAPTYHLEPWQRNISLGLVALMALRSLVQSRFLRVHRLKHEHKGWMSISFIISSSGKNAEIHFRFNLGSCGQRVWMKRCVTRRRKEKQCRRKRRPIAGRCICSSQFGFCLHVTAIK